MKKIFLIIFTFFLLIVLGINICSIKDIAFFKYRTFIISSGSMNPYLKVNDLIIIKEIKDYKINDVVTFKNKNEYITHRIIKIDGSQVITKGDANNVEDKPINKNQIIGKVLFKIHIVGFIAYLFKNSMSWILFFLLGLVITILIPNKK